MGVWIDYALSVPLFVFRRLIGRSTIGPNCSSCTAASRAARPPTADRRLRRLGAVLVDGGRSPSAAWRCPMKKLGYDNRPSSGVLGGTLSG